MGDIERTRTMVACPECGRDYIAEACAEGCSRPRPVRVEYIRADIHQGAVEALRVIAENRIGGYAESVPRTVQAYAQGALSRLDGGR